MIRAKGGRRQPRYHHLKDKASNRLCQLLEIRTEKPPEDDIVTKMLKMSEEVSLQLLIVKFYLWIGL